MTERVYFTEFINDLFWFDEKKKKWRPTDEHPNSSSDPNYEWKYVGDGQLPKDHPDAAKNNRAAEKMVDELEEALIVGILGKK